MMNGGTDLQTLIERERAHQRDQLVAAQAEFAAALAELRVELAELRGGMVVLRAMLDAVH